MIKILYVGKRLVSCEDTVKKHLYVNFTNKAFSKTETYINQGYEIFIDNYTMKDFKRIQEEEGETL